MKRKIDLKERVKKFLPNNIQNFTMNDLAKELVNEDFKIEWEKAFREHKFKEEQSQIEKKIEEIKEEKDILNEMNQLFSHTIADLKDAKRKLSRNQPRKRISKEEKRFIEILPHLNLNLNEKELLDILEENYHFHITDRTLRKYIKRHRGK